MCIEVSWALVDAHLAALYVIRMRLGIFDPYDAQPYLKLTTSDINTKEHKALALKAALESIVLIKNSRALLPLSSTVRPLCQY